MQMFRLPDIGQKAARSYISYPVCTRCIPHRSHPPGAPHIINECYYEERVDGSLARLSEEVGKKEHRRASVRGAVARYRERLRSTSAGMMPSAA